MNIEEIYDHKVIYMRRTGQYGVENYKLMCKMKAWADERGLLTNDAILFGIAEVRERMINEQPLVLCETANWNHRERQTKEGYLYNYMAKNLYYFECNKHNQFNPESDYRENTAEYIYLVPVGFAYNKKGVVTTDSDLFWAKPETIE